jgi:hypothetical protein
MTSNKTYTFAKIVSMTIAQACEAVGMTLDEARNTENLYFYASETEDGRFHVEAWPKADRHSDFEDDANIVRWGYAYLYV